MAKVATNQERLNQLFDADPRSDSAIGEALGVSKQTISAWRNGTRSPKRSMLTLIARHYNTSEEWLLGWDLPANGAASLTPAEITLISDFRSLNETGQQKVLSYAHDMTEIPSMTEDTSAEQDA